VAAAVFSSISKEKKGPSMGIKSKKESTNGQAPYTMYKLSLFRTSENKTSNFDKNIYFDLGL
jgi:hypothetical protein